MRTELFDFDLPNNLVALRPAVPRDSAEIVRHYVLGGEDLALIRGRRGGRSTGSDSPSSYASSGIPASAWDRPSNRRRR